MQSNRAERQNDIKRHKTRQNNIKESRNNFKERLIDLKVSQNDLKEIQTKLQGSKDHNNVKK